MEVPGGHQNKLSVCAYEFLGTALLLLSLNINTAREGLGFGPMNVSVMVFALIVITGPVSGAHANPAVSTAVLVREGCKNLSANLIFWLLIVIS